MSRLKRVVEVLLLMLFVFRGRTVTCQDKVQCFIGDTVLMPCVYTQTDPLPATVSVYWRDKDDKTVLDIKEKKQDLKSQDQNYQNRVVSFPKRYNEGNFSIEMRNVRQSDSGPYDCHIEEMGFEHRVVLTVSGKRVEEATPGPLGGAAVTPTSLHMVLLPLLLAVL